MGSSICYTVLVFLLLFGFVKTVEAQTKKPNKKIYDQIEKGIALGNAYKFADGNVFLVKAIEMARKANDPEAEATALNELGANYTFEGRLPEADSTLRLALSVGLLKLDKGNKQIGSSYHKLGSNFLQNSMFDSASAYLEMAFAHRKQYQGLRSIDVAGTCNNLGSVNERVGNYKKALSCYLIADTIFGEKLPPNHPYLATVKTNIGSAYRQLYDRANAIKYIDESMRLKKAIYPANHPEVFKSIALLGTTYLKFDNSFEAEKCLLQAYNGLSAVLDSAHPDLLVMRESIVFMYRNLGNLKMADQFAKTNLRLVRAKYGEDHIEYADALYNYYASRIYDGFLPETEQGFLLVEQIYKKNLPENHRSFIKLYNMLSDFYSNYGYLTQAMEYDQRLLNISKLLDTENSYEYFNNLTEVAGNYNLNGEFALAIELYKQSHNFMSSYLNDSIMLFGTMFSNLGYAYLHLNEYDSAIIYFNQAIPFLTKYNAINHLSVVFSNLSSAYENKGEFKRAIGLSKKAYQLMLSTDAAETTTDLVMALHNLGVQFGNLDQPDSALYYFNLALEQNAPKYKVTKEAEYPSPNYGIIRYEHLFETLIAKTVLLSIISETKKDPDLLKTAENILAYTDSLFSAHSLNLGSEQDKMYLVKYHKKIAQVGLLIAQINQKMGWSGPRPDLSFYYLERAKGNVLTETLLASKVSAFAGVPADAVALELQLRRKLNNIIQQQNYDKLSPGYLSNDSRIELVETQTRTRKSYDSLLTTFETNYPEYYKLKHTSKMADLDQARNMLSKHAPNAAIIHYNLSDTLLITGITTKNRHYTIFKKINLTDLNQQVQGFRNSVLFKSENMFKRTAYNLFNTLLNEELKKITTTEPNITDLIIIPDGILSQLPFEALITTPTPKGHKGYLGLNYLINKYNISYALSATLLFDQWAKPSLATKKDYVAFAPVFSSESQTNFLVGSCRRFIQSAERSLGSRAVRFTLNDRSEIAPLPSTRDEALEISSMVQKKNLFAKYFLFKDAKEEVIKAGELSGYRYVHFATHGFVNEDYPNLSGLLMSQDSTSAEDGILYASEIYNLNLNADLVTLSACETGLGKSVEGEGIVGLTRSFMYAGARNLLVSLWQVNDKATADFMISFYNELLSKPLGKSAAVGVAKRKMIKSPEYANPYFWAPFVLNGY